MASTGMTAAMERAKIAGTSIELSRVGLGTWAIGGWMWGGPDDDAAIATIRAAFAHGITLIDTAPVYGFGHAEELVGRALSEGGGGALRQRAVIATKVGIAWTEDGKLRRDASRRRIMTEIEDSLRRLRTDHIDIYQIHWPDPQTPMAETAATMRELFEAGTIGAIGVSNFSTAQMEAFRQTAPLHVVQPPYNLFEREAELHILPYCRAHDIATLGYGSLCRGLLSGKMHTGMAFTGDDLRRVDPKFQAPRFDQYLAAVARLDRLARERYGKSVIDLAVRWCLDQGITCALWGARRPDQLDAVDGVSDWSLDVAAKEAIETILEEEITDPVGPEFMAPPS